AGAGPETFGPGVFRANGRDRGDSRAGGVGVRGAAEPGRRGRRLVAAGERRLRELRDPHQRQGGPAGGGVRRRGGKRLGAPAGWGGGTPERESGRIPS